MPNQPSGWANSHWQSSVHRWLVSNLVVMFTLSLAAIASTMDNCPNFGTEFRTIGPGDTKRLWLITGELDVVISNLTLYNVSSSALTVDHKNDKLYLNNSSHTPVLTAWPAIPNWAGHVANVVLLQASDTQRRLILSVLNTENYYEEYKAFNFNTNKTKNIEMLNLGGRWISSDEEDRFYAVLDNGKKIISYNVTYQDYKINVYQKSTYNICNVTNESIGNDKESSVLFTEDNCPTNETLAETITNGFLNGNYFYLFGTKSVFIFSAIEVFNGKASKVTTLSFSQFVQCDQTSPSSTTTTSQSPATHSTVDSSTTTPSTSQSPLTTCPTLPSTEWTFETVSTDNWSLNTSSSSPTGFHHSRMTLILVVVLFVVIVVVVIALLAIVPCFYTSRRSTRGTRASTEKKRGKLSLGGKLKTPSLSAQPPPRVNSAFGKLDSNINLDIDIAQPSNSDMDAMNKVENDNNEQATASKPASKPVVVPKPKPTSAQVVAQAKKHKHSLPKVSLHHKHSRGNVHKQKAACSPMGANNHKRKHSAHKPVSARKA